MSIASKIVGQGNDSYDRLELIEPGTAITVGGNEAGLLVWDFEKTRVIFHHVSSVLYVDEQFITEENFPYAWGEDVPFGLYKVYGSTYLKRICDNIETLGFYFSSYIHLVYFKDAFFWNITCAKIEKNSDRS